MCVSSSATARNLLTALVVISVLLQAQCRRLEDVAEPRIMYGKEVDIKEFPYMVQLIRPGRLHCTGSLLTVQTVLTAGHCLVDASFNLIEDITVFIKRTEESIATKTLIPHPEFHGNVHATAPRDIGLIYLKSPSKYNDVFPVLNNQKYLEKIGTPLLLMGYGITEKGMVSNTLRYSEAEITSGKTYAGSFLVYNNISSICGGDSGGPAIARNGDEHIVVGVASGGRPAENGTCITVPQTFTTMSNFYEWANQEINHLMKNNH